MLLEKILLENGNIFRQFFISFLFAAIIVSLSYIFKFLSKSGSITSFILAFLIYGFGGLKWTIPIITFFILSSIISKIRSITNPAVDVYFDKSNERDYQQVLANGGIGGILVVINFFYPSELLYFLYVSFLAAVCADTWATEFGTICKTKTYNILNFKKIQQGQSGGVSINGFIGSILGALIIAISSLEWILINKFYFISFITCAGFLGSIVDSFLVASFQAQYKCEVCYKIIDRKIHCNKTASLHNGKRWMNNDMVNFSSGLAGSIIGVFLMVLL